MFVKIEERHSSPFRENGEELPFKITKLSMAIRVGAKLRPECRNRWSDGVGSCAVMAAGEATGFPYGKDPDGQRLLIHLMGHFGLDYRGATLIIEAFKKHDAGLSREAVAEWLEAQGK